MVIIALSKQVHLYSVDTSMFYNEDEQKIYDQLKELYLKRSKNNKDKNKFESNLNKILTAKKENKKLKKSLEEEKLTDEDIKQIREDHKKFNKDITKSINSLKSKLKIELNESNFMRTLNEGLIKETDIISMFDSDLIRAIGIPENTLSEDLIVVRTYYFDVLKDLITYGFKFKGEKYVIFTASAGQIRTKKTLFIKESVLHRVYDRITCGLTVEDINSQGGVNTNKYLAYLALCSSATDLWEDFDITKTIVVDDFETLVEGLVDYIDYHTYDITRRVMEVPITHTDGCGMMLGNVNKKSRMIRMPWVKGLLVPFPFDKFIKEQRKLKGDNRIGIIKDIYNKEHDIIKENIQVIFTRSQFKMWKYYKDWEAYKGNYLKYGSTANYCNEENEVFENAKLNYQMLQTLTDVTDEELTKLSQKTIHTINGVGSDRNIMLKVLGVTDFNTNKNNLQQALEIYPELLADEYTKETLRQAKTSMVKRAKSGKIECNAKYTFLIPDLHAFCENLFLNEEKPKGLLSDGEVYCNLYKDGTKLDCLRSPHLYREHAIRTNIVDRARSKWFKTNGIYTSSHDLISKLLMFDNDGDTSLVVGDQTMVEVAERNMQGIVPLYYEMKKAEEQPITKENIYQSIITAYTGGNIGIISNNISKIWNSKEPDLDMIKILCLENNFTIDYAKTLYKPERPQEINERMQKFTKEDVPYFFIHAKNKDVANVEEKNSSVINRLDDIIPSKRLHIKARNLGKIDYKLLMNKSSVIPEKFNEIISEYDKINKSKMFLYSSLKKKRYETGDDIYINEHIRNELLKIDDNVDNIVDALVKYLYVDRQTASRTTLWSSFGDVIVKNLKQNIKEPLNERWIQCECCGVRIKVTNNKVKYCDECANEKEKIRKREWKRKFDKKVAK